MRALTTSTRTCKFAVFAAVAVIIAGCSALPEKTDETATWSNQKLYSEAQDALTGKDYAKCSKYFEILEGRDPFGLFAQQGQLNIPYCYWKENEQASALTAVNRFIQLHPDHPNIDYAYYLKGLISFNDDLGLFGRYAGQDMSERDPLALRDSYDAFKVVVDKYPESKYAPDAAQRMRYIVNALASHEVHTAQYYYNRGAYIAAINRAQLAVKNYQNTPAVEDALHIMVMSYQQLGETKLATDTQSVLAATFPDSPYIPGNKFRRKTVEKPWYQIWNWQ